MAERSQVFLAVKALKVVLQNGEVAEKGHVAAIDTATGECVVSQTAAGLVPFGWFAESMTGDGTKKVKVDLFQEKRLVGFLNSSAPNNVTDADIGSDCYLAATATTVTTDSTGASAAGRVWIVDSLVYVEPSA
jgi:hypothetical protein